MKVKDVMNTSCRISRYDSSLTAVARLMYESGDSVLTVVNIDLRVLQVVGNRRLQILPSIQLRQPAKITVGELVLGNFYACNPEHDAESVVAMMRELRLLRLPVLDCHGAVRGMLSISDLPPAAGQEVGVEAPVASEDVARGSAAGEALSLPGLALVATASHYVCRISGRCEAQ